MAENLPDLKLFYLYIGGSMPGALVEVHDVRFAVAARLEDCYPALRRSWWGKPDSLHLDCWGELSQADGYDITLVPQTTAGAGALKLWFVNLGGYRAGEFAELHRNEIVVAETVDTAKTRALERVKNWDSPHRDRIFEVENIFCLDQVAAEAGVSLRLTPATAEKPFVFDYGYKPIAR